MSIAILLLFMILDMDLTDQYLLLSSFLLSEFFTRLFHLVSWGSKKFRNQKRGQKVAELRAKTEKPKFKAGLFQVNM